jgi:hypothetical protein
LKLGAARAKKYLKLSVTYETPLMALFCTHVQKAISAYLNTYQTENYFNASRKLKPEEISEIYF